jgi:parvulin-like peptidyl-prolyl isomerase
MRPSIIYGLLGIIFLWVLYVLQDSPSPKQAEAAAKILPEQPEPQKSPEPPTPHLRRPVLATAAQQEYEQWQRMFELGAEDRAERLALQGYTVQQWQQQILAQLAQQEWLSLRFVQGVHQPTETQLWAWYWAHCDQFVVPDCYRVRHLFLSAHEPAKPDRTAEIQAFSRQLRFLPVRLNRLAACYSEDERSKLYGGDLGWFTVQRMPADFIQAVRSLQPGQISPPIRTRLGWHLLELLDHQPARAVSFAEARSEILAQLLQRERETRLR